MDGSKYDGDNPKEIIDDTSEYYDISNKDHVKTAKVKQYIKDLSKRCVEINSLNNSNTAEAKKLFDTYFDADNLIDYQLINMACGDTDGFGNNWQWVTYDDVKWFVNQYDKDMSFGNYWTGMFTTPPLTGWIRSDDNMPIGICIRYYKESYKERWEELVKDGIFTSDYIKKLLSSWVNRIGVDNFKKEWKKWSESTCNRDSKIDFDNWRFDGGYSNSAPSNVTIWDDKTSYNENDTVWFETKDRPAGTYSHLSFKAIKNNINKPPLLGTYSKYPTSMGYHDSIWRFYKYIDQTLNNQNQFISNL